MGRGFRSSGDRRGGGEIELVDEAFFFEEVDGAIDGDKMTAGSIFWARARIWSTSRCCSAVSMTSRMTRRWRVRRIPFHAGFAWRCPVGSAVDAFAGRDAMGGGGSHGVQR